MDFFFQTGIFRVQLKSSLPSMQLHFEQLYQHYSKTNSINFIDYHVSVSSVSGYRRWLKPQIQFSFDGYEPFSPFPIHQAPAFFEWGLNWCIANNAHQYLIIHAAIVEKNGVGILLPGTPGSGKSTLCAALVCEGWRLLSDEMALLSVEDELIYPAPRPVSLKNQSIQIIKQFSPEAVFGDIIPDTTKGDIAYMRAPESSVLAQSIPVKPAFLVFPHYRAENEPELTPLAKSRAFMTLAENAFNFNILGAMGFEAMTGLIDKVECYDFSYPDLATALNGINEIVTKHGKE
ncbi:MAG: HprK-related kinase A [Methylococcaceae bacterium]